MAMVLLLRYCCWPQEHNPMVSSGNDRCGPRTRSAVRIRSSGFANSTASSSTKASRLSFKYELRRQCM